MLVKYENSLIVLSSNVTKVFLRFCRWMPLGRNVRNEPSPSHTVYSILCRRGSGFRGFQGAQYPQTDAGSPTQRSCGCERGGCSGQSSGLAAGCSFRESRSGKVGNCGWQLQRELRGCGAVDFESYAGQGISSAGTPNHLNSVLSERSAKQPRRSGMTCARRSALAPLTSLCFFSLRRSMA